MNTEQSQEMWQVESGGEVFDTTFAEMTTWIDDGSLLKIDRVRKANLRWIEAGKVPSLLAVFNAKEAGEPVSAPVVTLTKLGPATVPGSSSGNPPNFTQSPLNKSVRSSANTSVQDEKMCAMHTDVPAIYICETCANLFCQACPNSYGGTVKVCPFCGAMCAPIAQVQAAQSAAAVFSEDLGAGFGFNDFARAFTYPFKFKTSLVMGAIMYAFLSIGQGAMSFGGIYMLGGALACFLVANTLTFGILANTVENFSQGKIGLNFMPSFEDFSIWDDVVHPFFLSLGVYAVSFGPLIALILVAFFWLVNPAEKQMNALQSDAAQIVTPELPYAAKSVQQSQTVKELLNKQAGQQKQRVDALQEREKSVDEQVRGFEEDHETQPIDASKPSTLDEPEKWHNPSAVKLPPPPPVAEPKADPEDEYFNRVNQTIQDSRKAELESTVGKMPETRAAEQSAMIKQILGYGIIFLLLGAVFLLWGLLYFPAACAVAGYTRSFTATLNPTVGFDTIKHLGFDYVKILLMALVLAIISGFVGTMLNSVFAAFDIPSIGNLPAKTIGSLFGFYLSIVFSCVLGFALYKNADRLKLYR